MVRQPTRPELRKDLSHTEPRLLFGQHCMTKAFRENLKSQLFAERRATYERRARFALTECLWFKAKRFNRQTRAAKPGPRRLRFMVKHNLNLKRAKL